MFERVKLEKQIKDAFTNKVGRQELCSAWDPKSMTTHRMLVNTERNEIIIGPEPSYDSSETHFEPITSMFFTEKINILENPDFEIDRAISLWHERVFKIIQLNTMYYDRDLYIKVRDLIAQYSIERHSVLYKYEDMSVHHFPGEGLLFLHGKDVNDDITMDDVRDQNKEIYVSFQATIDYRKLNESSYLIKAVTSIERRAAHINSNKEKYEEKEFMVNDIICN